MTISYTDGEYQTAATVIGECVQASHTLLFKELYAKVTTFLFVLLLLLLLFVLCKILMLVYTNVGN